MKKLELGSLNEILETQFNYGIDLENRIIYILNELNENIGTELRIKHNMIKLYWEHVREEQYKDITLDINSFGGSIYAINSALDFYDDLKDKGILVNTDTSSVCMSAATLLLSGGTGCRTASKRAKLMLHDIQIESNGGTVQQLKHFQETLNKEQLDLFTLYVEFANRGTELTEKLKKKEAEKWIKKYCSQSVDFYISSEEMLNLKLIDKVR